MECQYRSPEEGTKSTCSWPSSAAVLSKVAWTVLSFVHRAPFGCAVFQQEPESRTGLPISLTFHYILLVVTVIVTVSGAVVDVKSVDGSVVVAGWNVLQRMGGRAEISRDVHARIVLGEEQLG